MRARVPARDCASPGASARALASAPTLARAPARALRHCCSVEFGRRRGARCAAPRDSGGQGFRASARLRGGGQGASSGRAFADGASPLAGTFTGCADTARIGRSTHTRPQFGKPHGSRGEVRGWAGHGFVFELWPWRYFVRQGRERRALSLRCSRRTCFRCLGFLCLSSSVEPAHCFVPVV